MKETCRRYNLFMQPIETIPVNDGKHSRTRPHPSLGGKDGGAEERWPGEGAMSSVGGGLWVFDIEPRRGLLVGPSDDSSEVMNPSNDFYLIQLVGFKASLGSHEITTCHFKWRLRATIFSKISWERRYF